MAMSTVATAEIPPTRCDEYFVPQKNRTKPPLNEVPYPKELKTDYGFSHLPEKFNILVTLFNEMEKIFSYGRGLPKTLNKLKEDVEKNSKKKFTQKHLAQIVSVYPAAYKLYRERQKGGGKRAIQFVEELFIQPNLQGNKDLAPFIDDYLASSTKIESNNDNGLIKTTKKMDGNDEEENKSKWAMPLAAADEKSTTKSPLKRPAASTTNLPPSPVKLISPIKSPRRNIDFVFRSPQKSPSTKPKMGIIFCPPLLDDRPKMDANRMTWRKMIFRHKLVSRVREAHAKFLAENKLKFESEDTKHWVHPLFEEAIEQIVPDIVPLDGCIPGGHSGGQNHLHTTDIRTFLQSVKHQPISTAERRDKTPEGRPGTLAMVCKSEPNTPQTAAKTNPSVKFEPITPKTPVEQRLKAKFAANEAALKAGFPELQKRRAMLHKLVNEGGTGILEVIRAHLNLEQRNSVGLDNAQFISKLGREIRGTSLLEHLRLLCDLVVSTSTISSNNATDSNYCCWLESVGSKHYFKISPEMGPHWIDEAKKAVALELANLEGKMRTLHRSPSSCFDDLN